MFFLFWQVKTKVQELFDQVCFMLGVKDNQYFGLCLENGKCESYSSRSGLSCWSTVSLAWYSEVLSLDFMCTYHVSGNAHYKPNLMHCSFIKTTNSSRLQMFNGI